MSYATKKIAQKINKKYTKIMIKYLIVNKFIIVNTGSWKYNVFFWDLGNNVMHKNKVRKIFPPKSNDDLWPDTCQTILLYVPPPHSGTVWLLFFEPLAPQCIMAMSVYLGTTLLTSVNMWPLSSLSNPPVPMHSTGTEEDDIYTRPLRDGFNRQFVNKLNLFVFAKY